MKTKVKMKGNNFKNNVIKGFIIAIIPIIIIDILLISSLGFFEGLTYRILTHLITYGLVGIVISILYTYMSKSYPKFSQYSLYFIIVGYYLIYFAYSIATVYLRDKII